MWNTVPHFTIRPHSHLSPRYAVSPPISYQFHDQDPALLEIVSKQFGRRQDFFISFRELAQVEVAIPSIAIDRTKALT